MKTTPGTKVPELRDQELDLKGHQEEPSWLQRCRSIKIKKIIILKDPIHSSPMPSTTGYRHRLVLIAFSFPKIRRSSLLSALTENELEGGRQAVDARCQLTESSE